jgi:hypothetical protein
MLLALLLFIISIITKLLRRSKITGIRHTGKAVKRRIPLQAAKTGAEAIFFRDEAGIRLLFV